jgi:hypothetical protein
MATQAQVNALLRRMREMSAADISVLEASVNTPDSNVTTAPGSPNEKLWSEMEALGWMVKRNEELELGGGMRFPMAIYSFTTEGRLAVSSLLAILASNRSR